MKTSASFEIRVGRPILTCFFLVAALFLYLGLDLVALHSIIKPEYIQDQPMFIWALFGVFFLLVPGVVIWKMLRYLIRPPVMLRVDEQNISFGTGFGYKLHSIPTCYVKSVGFGLADPNMTDIRPESWLFGAGLHVAFQKADAVPAGLVTSAGITYGFYRLKLRALYMNMRVKTAVEGIEPFLSLEGGNGQVEAKGNRE